MEWLRRNTTIPVPRIQTQGWDIRRRQYYAIFDTPEGMPLADCWEDLPDESRERAVRDARSALKQLRSIGEGKLPNLGTRDAFLNRRNGVVAGPFLTQGDFLDGLATRIDAIGSIYNPGSTRKALKFIEALKHMQPDNRMIFTHGNLNPDNIWVDTQGRVTAIIDWSQAGYAPSFWEYVKASLSDNDSEVHLEGFYDEIMETCPLQLAVMMHVHDIIW